MNKGLEVLKKLEDLLSKCLGCDIAYCKEFELLDFIGKSLRALNIIVKKANIRIFEECGIYYFKTTNNLYQISEEKYFLLKEVLL